jgi:glycerol kinase
MTCLGAAYIAGLARGVYDRQSLSDNLQYKEYLPQMSVQIRNKKLAGWDQAIKLSLGH